MEGPLCIVDAKSMVDEMKMRGAADGGTREGQKEAIQDEGGERSHN